MTQRVLVTGAGGFVGQNIVQALLAAGTEVLALDRSFDNDIRQAWQASAHHRVDLLNDSVENLPNLDVNAVIHCAAITASPEEAGHTPEENYRANINSTLHVLEWAHRQKVQRVIFLSSSAVYRATSPGLVSESMPTTPLGLYATAKDAAEKLIETLRTQHGRDVIAIRLSNIYGPHERTRASRPHTSLVSKMVQTALAQGHLTVFRQDDALDWTFAPDIGRAIGSMLTASTLQHHLYHVASGQVLRPLDIAYGIKTVLPSVKLTIHEGRDPDSTARTRLGCLSSERLHVELGFDQWTSFEQGIRAVITWQQTERVQ